MNQDLKANIVRLPKNLSTYVVLLITGVATYWLQLDPAEQAKLMAAYPWLKHVAPLSALVAFLGARVWPQTPQTPPEDPPTEPQS